MKKLLSVILCFAMVFAVVSISGCSDNSDLPNAEKRTVVDMLGKEVQIPATVENYSVLYSSAVPICGMLDKDFEHMHICPKGYAEWINEIFPEVYSHATIVDKKAVTAEEIIDSGAQVVFWSQSYNEEVVEALEKVGIACVNVKISDEQSAIKVTQIIADVFGTDYAKSQAAKYIDLMKKARQDAVDLVANIPEEDIPTVLVLGGADTLEAFTAESYEYYWASQLRFDYILPPGEETQKVNLTMEQIYEYDPDIIIFEGWTDVNPLYEDPAWANLKAAKNNMLFDTPMVLDVWCKPGAEAPLMYMWAISKCYSEYAQNINMEDELISHFKTLFDYDMSKEDAAVVLDGGIPEFK